MCARDCALCHSSMCSSMVTEEGFTAGNQGPKALETLASGAGMLGSWKVILQGDFSGIPFTAFWRHRCGPVQVVCIGASWCVPSNAHGIECSGVDVALQVFFFESHRRVEAYQRGQQLSCALLAASTSAPQCHWGCLNFACLLCLMPAAG